jgi:hypothetical protein
VQVYIQCFCSFEADVNVRENGCAAVLRSDTETSVKVIHVYIDHKLYVVYDCLYAINSAGCFFIYLCSETIAQ